ncbi:GntR family transcriptional regulator [Klenkia marina]|uniref:GntR family transcriptional regulator n=1 Tax=Klenkia marina TaxID=1960309 RepID=UPI000B832190|nr:GntR family transcriptional regulator [Klenkia marina]
MAREPGRRSSRRQVYETLRQRVLTLELPPGTALSENELATALQVSRTPVRESLILLAEEGLVQVFPQIGSFVSRVDPAQVADAQFLREAVELAALEDLPGELDAGVVARLRANLDEQAVADLDREAFFALDEAFHQGVLELSGHGRTWSTVLSAKGHLDRARRLGLSGTETQAQRIAEHGEVLSAVLDGDVERARAAMRVHLRAVFDDVERIQQRSPELFAGPSTAGPVRRNVVIWA